MIRTLLQDHDVLIDETHTSRTNITKTLLIDPEAEWCFIDTDPETCTQRAEDTNHKDLFPVIERMTDNLLRMCDVEHWHIVKNKLPSIIEELRHFARENKEKFERISD